MRKKWLLAILLAMPMQMIAQGIQFNQGQSWQQVQERAKSAHKYIFMDVYATWCGPCRQMDQQVYPDEKVGGFINGRFISVKIQIDSTKQDNERVRSWYADAAAIKKEYKITGLPGFLFFSPAGKLVYRGEGAVPKEKFLEMVEAALDQDSLLGAFKVGKLAHEAVPGLITQLEKTGDRVNAKLISIDYVKNYLFKLSDDQLFTRSNIEFLGRYINDYADSPNDQAFQLFVNQPENINKLTRPGYDNSALQGMITRTNIIPILWKDVERTEPVKQKPNWSSIDQAARTEFGKAYSARTLLNAKLDFYTRTQQWPELIDAQVENIEKYGLDTAGFGSLFINNMVYNIIFFHSDNKVILNKAIGWMEIILKNHPNDYTKIDTYANLLYKTGRRERAIEIETEALDLAVSHKDPDVGDYKTTLEKMKAGQATWVTN